MWGALNAVLPGYFLFSDSLSSVIHPQQTSCLGERLQISLASLQALSKIKGREDIYVHSFDMKIVCGKAH